MEKCEMLLANKTHEVWYNGGEIILCDIAEGKCPYNNAGEPKKSIGDLKIRYICKTNGMVEKSGLIKNIQNITKP